MYLQFHSIFMQAHWASPSLPIEGAGGVGSIYRSHSAMGIRIATSSFLRSLAASAALSLH